jgi:hypothetical protein
LLPEEIRADVPNISERSIRKFLLEQEYIEPVNHSIPSDELVAKGKKAADLGGHGPYLEWEKAEKRKKYLEDFPKKKWYVYEPVKTVVSWAIVALVSGMVGYFIGQRNASSSHAASSPGVQRRP